MSLAFVLTFSATFGVTERWLQTFFPGWLCNACNLAAWPSGGCRPFLPGRFSAIRSARSSWPAGSWRGTPELETKD